MRPGRRAATGCRRSTRYLTVLRQAFQRKGSGPSLEIYFGSTTGEVFGSGDAGATWFEVTARLPPVYAVSAG